jgi:acyl-CoA synthetase (AMP-forming)/AMP-acid ligase II
MTATLDLATILRAVAAEHPSRDAIVCGELRRPWAEFDDRTDRLANVLLSLGVGGDVAPASVPWGSSHDHLGVFALNGPEYIEAVVGAHKARVAPFNVNYRYTGGELDYLFADATPAVLVYQSRFAQQVAAAIATMTAQPALIEIVDGTTSELLPGAIDFEAAIASSSPRAPTARPSGDDLHLLYTGGTTGMPKGVLWRVADLVAGPLGMRRRDGTAFDDVSEVLALAQRRCRRVLPSPPLMHGAGMWFALGALCTGGCVAIQASPDRFSAADILSTVERHQVEELVVVGDAFVAPLLDELTSTSAQLGTLRLVVNSGAALRDELKARLAAAVGPDVRIVDMLGSSETGPQASRDSSSSTFQPRPGLRVVSEDFSRLLDAGDDEVGWLGQTGPIPRGYLGDEVKTSATFRTIDGERYSIPGDRVRLETDGTFTLFGRESTTINTGGEKVFAEEVEGVLKGLPLVTDALVLGEPSERWGQSIAAVVALAASPGPSDDELLAGAALQLARYKLPKRIVRVDRVARQPNGKADYTWARGVLAGGAAEE